MRCCLFIVLFIILGLRGPQAQVKTYTLESFDGHPTKVTLYDKPFGKPFYVSIPTDRFAIADYWSEVNTKLINRHFLLITYAVRCGTNTGMHRTAIICINKGKLYQAAHLVSYYNEDTPEHYLISRLQLKLSGTGSNTYQLIISSCKDSAKAPIADRNLRYRSAGTMRFSPTDFCFYSSRKAIDKTVKVYNPKTGNMEQKHLPGPYPYASFNNSAYYLIDREWHEAGPNTLYKYSYR